MREYVKPTMEGEVFAANEYIAACGDSGVTYYFECNAGEKDKKYAVKDSRGMVATISGMYMNGGKLFGYYYQPCGDTHVAESDSGFLTGYHIDDVDTRWDENIPVVIWTDYNRDVHCTINLDMDEWTTQKS